MILLRLPISYQLAIVININVDINYQNRLLSISIQYQSSEHSLININIAIFAYQYFLINALSSSVTECCLRIFLKQFPFKKQNKLHFLPISNSTDAN